MVSDYCGHNNADGIQVMLVELTVEMDGVR